MTKADSSSTADESSGRVSRADTTSGGGGPIKNDQRSNDNDDREDDGRNDHGGDDADNDDNDKEHAPHRGSDRGGEHLTRGGETLTARGKRYYQESEQRAHAVVDGLIGRYQGLEDIEITSNPRAPLHFVSKRSRAKSRLVRVCGVATCDISFKAMFKFCSFLGVPGYTGKTQKELCDLIVEYKLEHSVGGGNAPSDGAAAGGDEDDGDDVAGSIEEQQQVVVDDEEIMQAEEASAAITTTTTPNSRTGQGKRATKRQKKVHVEIASNEEDDDDYDDGSGGDANDGAYLVPAKPRRLYPNGDHVFVRRVITGAHRHQKHRGYVADPSEPHEGKVVAVGPGTRDDRGILHPANFQVGDSVLLPPAGGVRFELNGDVMFVYREAEILGTFSSMK